jgi:hypothetical protein
MPQRRQEINIEKDIDEDIDGNREPGMQDAKRAKSGNEVPPKYQFVFIGQVQAHIPGFVKTRTGIEKKTGREKQKNKKHQKKIQEVRRGFSMDLHLCAWFGGLF